MEEEWYNGSILSDSCTVALPNFFFYFFFPLSFIAQYIFFIFFSTGVENSNCSTNGRATETLTYQGIIHMTLGGSEVATFNFERIYLGAGVQVETFGVRALSLLSRSSAIIDTPIIALPGELGGFVGMFPFLLCVLC